MSLSFALAIIATSVGSVMALSPLLQARSMLRSRSSRDVSMAAMWIFVLNCVAWASYGLSIGSVPLVIPNTLALIALSVAIAVALRMRRVEHAAAQGETGEPQAAGEP